MIIVRNNLKGTKKRIRSKKYQIFEKAMLVPVIGITKALGKVFGS